MYQKRKNLKISQTTFDLLISKVIYNIYLLFELHIIFYNFLFLFIIIFIIKNIFYKNTAQLI